MNIDRFWELIDRTAFASSKDEQLQVFRHELDQLRLDELDKVGEIFCNMFIEAYNWDLWLVAWLARRGMCSDDSFRDLRFWLISRGRQAFETAINDPEGVAELIYHAESPRFEAFPNPLSEVRRKLTDLPPPSLGSHPVEPSGGDWLRPALKNRRGCRTLNLSVVFRELDDSDFTAIQARFPKLWDFCLRQGIVRDGASANNATLSSSPTIEKLAATVDPELARINLTTYLKEILDRARHTYRKKR